MVPFWNFGGEEVEGVGGGENKVERKQITRGWMKSQPHNRALLQPYAY